MKNLCALPCIFALCFLSACDADTVGEPGADVTVDGAAADTVARIDVPAVADDGTPPTPDVPGPDPDVPSPDPDVPPPDLDVPPPDPDVPPPGPDADPVTPDGESTNDPPTEQPPIDASFTTWIGDWEMSPGQEVTKCVVKKLDNQEAVWMTAIHTSLAAGSHHMIVYRTDGAEEQPNPFSCTPFTETLGGEAFPLIITQVAEESLVMPPGVAVKFEPNQTIRIEAHFLNYYPETITAHGEVIFDTIAEEDVWHEANMLFYGDVDFQLPANQSYQSDWVFLPVADGVEVFAMTGHTHQFGTNVEVYHAQDIGDASTPIYPLDMPFLWDESPVTQYDPPLLFNGGDGLRMRCSWENTSNKSVGFGQSATDEMCFVWAYYYPSEGYRVCAHIGGFGASFGLEHICCPGSFICDLIPGFL